MKNIKLILIFCLVFSSAALFAQNKRSFKIIVNKSNSTSTLTKKEVSKLFLKKTTRWKELDIKVDPVDLTDDSVVRIKFSNEILGKKVGAVKAYWQKLIFSGRRVPPPEKKTDIDVLKYVHENTGAIGYVSNSANLKNYDVKILKVE